MSFTLRVKREPNFAAATSVAQAVGGWGGNRNRNSLGN